jgi:hypothetical protein
MDLSCPLLSATYSIHLLFRYLVNLITFYETKDHKSPNKTTLASSLCLLPEPTSTYHVRSAPRSTLPMAMSTQSLVRAVDDTEDCRSIVSVICKRIDCFDKSSDM